MVVLTTKAKRNFCMIDDTKVYKYHLRPGLVFKSKDDQREYKVVKCGDYLEVLDDALWPIGRIVPCFSHKGFNLELSVCGKKKRVFIQFNNLIKLSV